MAASGCIPEVPMYRCMIYGMKLTGKLNFDVDQQCISAMRLHDAEPVREQLGHAYAVICLL